MEINLHVDTTYPRHIYNSAELSISLEAMTTFCLFLELIVSLEAMPTFAIQEFNFSCSNDDISCSGAQFTWSKDDLYRFMELISFSTMTTFSICWISVSWSNDDICLFLERRSSLEAMTTFACFWSSVFYFYTIYDISLLPPDPRHANNCVEMGLDMISLITEVWQNMLTLIFFKNLVTQLF